jgi:hypothetical protein
LPVLLFIRRNNYVHLRTLVLTTLATAAAAFAQNPITADSPFQVRYASNLTAGDSYVNISNTGARGGVTQVSGTSASIGGSLCANVYVFSPDEEMVSCCSCPVTPNGLVSLSAQKDLIINPLTRGTPTSIVIKLIATAPIGGSCNTSAAAVSGGGLVNGMVAWGTTLHSNTSAAAGTYNTTETAFTPSSPSASEISNLATECAFIVNQGSGAGLCNSCRLGGLGASAGTL